MEKVQYTGTDTSYNKDHSVDVSFLKIIPKIVIFVARADPDETVILSDYANKFDRGNTAYYSFSRNNKVVTLYEYGPHDNYSALNSIGTKYEVIGIEL